VLIFGARLAASPAPPWRDDRLASAPLAGRWTDSGVESAFSTMASGGGEQSDLSGSCCACVQRKGAECDTMRPTEERRAGKQHEASASERSKGTEEQQCWSIKITAAIHRFGSGDAGSAFIAWILKKMRMRDLRLECSSCETLARTATAEAKASRARNRLGDPADFRQSRRRRRRRQRAALTRCNAGETERIGEDGNDMASDV
jgi:hypothetical protein